MNRKNSDTGFELAKEMYADIGVDVDTALKILAETSLSIHCWQADDLSGFEHPDSKLSGGGIQITGNYPGKAKNLEEVKAYMSRVFSMVPGKLRLSLHAIYGDFKGDVVDRDEILPEHFTSWCDWAKAENVKLDFNSTFFSHPKAEDGFTLSSKDDSIRGFWVNHAKRCRDISAYIGTELNGPCIHNIWIPDGAKDITVDRFGYRGLLKESLDEIFREGKDPKLMKDALESKLFGIGSESYVVGSHEFYLGYALSRNKLICLDMGHFHPTESVADKVSALFHFTDELVFHISRPVRWDSDHVVILDDPTRALLEELVRSGHLSGTHLGLDFFDGTIDRVGAMTLGARAALKALLLALLQPAEVLREFEEQGNSFAKLALLEDLKTKPYGLVWDYYCQQNGKPMESEIAGKMTR